MKIEVSFEVDISEEITQEILSSLVAANYIDAFECMAFRRSTDSRYVLFLGPPGHPARYALTDKDILVNLGDLLSRKSYGVQTARLRYRPHLIGIGVSTGNQVVRTDDLARALLDFVKVRDGAGTVY